MLKSIRNYLGPLAQRRFPGLYYRLVQKPRFRRQFANERQLARGVVLTSNPHPSILAFTHAKCASRYLYRILKRLASAEGMLSIDFDAYVTIDPPSTRFKPYSPEGSLAQAFRPQGYCYGPIGTFRQIPQMDDYLTVVHLRDPRDVLTSLYYSTAYSHGLISEKLLRRREEAQQVDVDQFVLDNLDEVQRAYGEYCQQIEARRLPVLRYEDMVADFGSWLDQLAGHLQLSQHQDVVAALKAEADFSVDQEDVNSHRRQVTPGDHRRKLQPATIERLNQELGEVLAVLNYAR